MPIAFDASSNGSGGAVSSVTVSHTCSGSDRLLVVGISMLDAAAVGNVTGVTYNGVALTQIHEFVVGGVRSAELWRLIAPDTGTNNIVVSISNSTTDSIVVGGVSFTGVDQTTPTEAQNEIEADSNAPSLTITTVTDNAWVIDCLYAQFTPTVDASQTQRWNVAHGSMFGAGSTEGPKTPAGAVTMSWTLSAADPWIMVGCGIKPSAATAIKRRRMMGVGQ